MLHRLGPTPLIFTAFWLFFLVVGQSKLLRDPGTLWHTKVGEKVLAEGFFKGDPYTFTYAGQPWVPHQWLGEVIMAIAYRIGGFDTFVMLAATILATLFTWLMLRLLNTGLNFAVAALISGCALAATSTHLHVRPLLMTTVALAITAALLTDCEDRKTPLRRLFWLIPLFIVWTNTHGGMLGGLASLGLVIIGWIVARLVGWPSPIRCHRGSIMLLGVLVLCGLTMFANPYGSETPKAWWSIMRAPKIPEIIEEHQPLDVTKPTAWALFLFAAIYFFMLGGLKSKPRITWLLPLFWLMQAFFRVRHAPLFALTAFVAVIAMWPYTRWAIWLDQYRPDVYQPRDTPKPIWGLGWLVPALLVAVSLVLQSSNVEVPIIGARWAKLDTERWPIEIVHEVQSTPWPGAKVFNDCEFGGFLIFFAPHCQIFIDDRAELYGEDFLDEFVRGGTFDTAEAMARWQAKYGTFDYALVRPGNQFDEYFLHAGWTRLAQCEAGHFYRR